jgi:predicted NBD/HSP70 family sugar kinase
VLQADTVSKKMEMRKNILLQHIYRNGSIGRLELGRDLGMSKSRLCEVVQEMIDEKLIVESLDGTERRGRSPVPLSANPDHGCFVGLDFEAQRMRIVVVDFSGKTLLQRHQKLEPMKSRKKLISRLLRFIDKGLKAARGIGTQILGVGVAAPGIINRNTGTLIHYEFLEAARDVPLKELIEDRTGLPCVVDNNIRCYALTEWTSGVAKNMSNFICLAVRSGFGSAIILNGQLLDGSHGFSGEAGYTRVPSSKPASEWKTFQEVVSEKALNVDVEAKDFKLPRKKAQVAGELLGARAASLATLLDPEAIILVGRLLEADGPLWSFVEETYGRFILPDIAEMVPLLHSRVDSYAAAVGATQRCFQELFPIESN